jgi:quercetin dioxygenase-like cupin family protein
MSRITTLATLTVTALFTAVVVAQQQPPAAPIKRTPLQTVDVVGSPYQTVTGIAEIAPNVNIGRHTHPGYETGYLLEGDLTLLVEGKPALPLKPGESYQIPLNAVHDARSGDKGAKVLAVYIVERGKPLAVPAP